MTSEQFIRSEKALQVLRGSDWVVARALEASIMGPEWCAWRDRVRKIAETGEGEIPPEPPRKVNVHAQAPAFVDVPAFLQDTPPHEVVELLADHGLTPGDTYERVNESLVSALTKAKSSAELARGYGGVFDGKSVVEWERKAQAINESIRWNSGRKVETI